MPNPTPYEQGLKAELAAIRRIVAALDTIDPPAQSRIVHYLVERYDETRKPE